MMEREYIQKLLDSYMATETTKEEEQLLSDYFSTHRDIPTEWRDFSILFRGIRQYEQKPHTSYRRAIMKWSAAAAVIAILFGTGLSLQHQEETSEPSEAIAHAKGEESSVIIAESQMPTSAPMRKPARASVPVKTNPSKVSAPNVIAQPVTSQPSSGTITEQQEAVCIDCELGAMEDEMLAMMKEFGNM